MTGESSLTLVVLALCAFRLTRFVVDDSLTAPARMWLWRRAYVVHGYDSQTEQQVAVRRSRAWEKAFQLVECPWCSGVWLCALVWWAWYGWPWDWVRPAVALGAVMGMQGALNAKAGR